MSKTCFTNAASRSATKRRDSDINTRRLLEPIGNIPPAEAEARFYAQTDELAMVA
jgi:transposase InsO family protein